MKLFPGMVAVFFMVPIDHGNVATGKSYTYITRFSMQLNQI